MRLVVSLEFGWSRARLAPEEDNDAVWHYEVIFQVGKPMEVPWVKLKGVQFTQLVV